MAAEPDRNTYANYTPQIRGRIVGLWQSGCTVEQIRDEIGCNIKTVRLWIRRFEEGGDQALADHRKRNRGVKRTTLQEDNQIFHYVDDNPFTTAPEVLAAVHTELPISVRTVHRRLKSTGITAHRPLKKIALTEEHRAERLQFARAHVDWEPEQWAAVIWSDEKVFKSTDDGRTHVYRPRGQEYALDERYVVETHRSGRITCGFWGCMSASGLMELREITPHMNSDEYVELLDTVMLPCARARFPEEQYPVIHFMHDNSSVHTSAVTRAWFEEHPEVVLMNWPSKSPDLNPIENIWSFMVKGWRSGQDRTRDALRDHALAVWEEHVPRQDLTQSLVNSMRNRLQCVIDNNGFWTKY